MDTKILTEALEEIAKCEGMTLLGQDPEHEYIPRSYPGEERAHETGANKAFGQCAGIAKRALASANGAPDTECANCGLILTESELTSGSCPSCWNGQTRDEDD